MIKKRIAIDVEIILGDSSSPKDFILERKSLSQNLDSVVCSIIRGDYVSTDKFKKLFGWSMLVNDLSLERPTLDEIQKCIEKRGLTCLAGRVYLFWQHRKWIDKDGTDIIDADDAVERYNSKFPQKKSRLPKKSLKKIRRNAHCRVCQRKSNEKRKVEHPNIDYNKQLKDQRWFDFREKVFEVKGRICEKCGSTEHLQIHHPKYKSGKYAWEYDENEMMVLCDKCHASLHGKV